MNKKLMIAMVVAGMSALYVRFQVVGMESGDRIYQAAERRRVADEAGRVAQVAGTKAPEVSTGPSAEIIKNNMDQMWKYEIGKMMPLPPKVKAFLYSKLCIPNRVRMLGHGGLVYSVAFSPDGRLLATGSEGGTAGIWDVASGQRLQTLQQGNQVYSVAFSPDGRLLATGSEGGTAAIWDVANGNRVQTLQHSNQVYSVAFSPDGRLLATGSEGGTAAIWDVANGNRVQTLQHSNQVYSVAFSPDGRLLATGSEGGTAAIWDVENGNRVRILQPNYSIDSVSVAFSLDGKLLATGFYRKVEIWDVASGNKLQTLQRVTWVKSVAFSPDGRLLATGSLDHTAVIWDVASGNKLQTLQHGGCVDSVVFSPDGKLLATANGRVVFLWNVECFQTLERSIITTSAQYELIHRFELTFESKGDKQFGRKRPVGRIQATPEQWATFLTLPQPVQDALKVRIKDPQEAEDRDIPEHSAAAGAEEAAERYLDVGHSGIG